MSKLSSYTGVHVATSVGAADSIYLVQGGVSKRANLTMPWAFGGDVSIAGALSLTGTVVAPIKNGDGSVSAPAYSFSSAATTGLYLISGPNVGVTVAGTRYLSIGSGAVFVDFGGLTIRDLSLGFNTGAKLIPDADNVLAQRNGANAQMFRIYNTFTDASNYERGTLMWTTNELQIGTQNAGTGSARLVRFIGGGATLLALSPAASAVNYVQINNNVTGSAPFLTSAGSDTNIDLRYLTKGTGGHDFWTNNTMRQFNIGHVLNAVNYLQVFGNTTGNYPAFQAQGSDANVGIDFRTKGTGSFNFKTNTDAVAATQVVISHTSSAVNQIQMTGGATTASPALFMVGTDTNIGFVIGSKGTGAVNISTNGTATPQFQVTHTASAVNGVQITGSSTGNGVFIGTFGSDTNISINLTTKGTGQLNVTTGGGNQFVVSNTASAVNRWQFTGSATGNSISATASGSDSDINLLFQTKGTGAFLFNDGSGARLIQLDRVASAVNHISLQNNSTGNGPVISAQGETNVTLDLRSKGTGNLVLQPNTGDIRWGKALVALGGGAAPTFGTIGGSGPATAAQNSWMRVLDSAGAAFWVPAWK